MGVAPERFRCTAKSKRSQERCRAGAVKGTDKCRMHGGKAKIKHGLRSKWRKTRLAEEAERLYAQGAKLLDLTSQIAIQHALLQQAMTTLETAEKACDPKGILSALDGVHTLTETISRNIERHAKITVGSTLNLAGRVDGNILARIERVIVKSPA